MKDLDNTNIININEFNEYEAEVNRELANHPEGYELSVFEHVLEGLEFVKDNFPGFEDEIYCMAVRRNEFMYYQSAISGTYDESGHTQRVAVYDDEKKRMAELTVDMSMLFDKLLKQYPDVNSIQNKIIKLFVNQLDIYKDKDYFADYGKNYAFHANMGYAFTLLTDAHSAAVGDEELDIEGYENYMQKYPVIDSINDSQQFYLNVYKPYMKKKAEGTLDTEQIAEFKEQYKDYVKTQISYYEKINKQHEDGNSEYFDFTGHDSDYFRTGWIISDLSDELDFLNMGWPVEDISILLQVKKLHNSGVGIEENEVNDFYNELLHKPVTDEKIRKNVLDDVKAYVREYNEKHKEIDLNVYNKKEEKSKKDKVYDLYLKKYKKEIKKLQNKADKLSKNIQETTATLENNMNEIKELQNKSLNEKDPKKLDEIRNQIEEAHKKEGVLYKSRKAELETNIAKYSKEKTRLDNELKNNTAMAGMKGITQKDKKQIAANIKKLKADIYTNNMNLDYDKGEYDSLIENPKTVEQEFNELAVWQMEQNKKLQLINAKVARKENAVKILEENEKKAVTGNGAKEVEYLDIFEKNFDAAVEREVVKEEMGVIDNATVEEHAKKIETDNKRRKQIIEKGKKIAEAKKADDKKQPVENKAKKDGKKNADKMAADKTDNIIISVEADNTDNIIEIPNEADNYMLVNMENDFKEFAAFQLTNINGVDRFVRSSKEFTNIKNCLIAMNKKMFDTWKDKEFSPELKAVDFVEMSEELRTYIMDYLNKKETQMASDPARKDSWRKSFHEQPRIKTVIKLLENLDAMTECAETALSATTATWKELVSLKKETIKANAGDNLNELDEQLRSISGNPNNKDAIFNIVYKVIANGHLTMDSFYNQMKTENEEAYKARISASLDGEYVNTLEQQIRNNENISGIVDDCVTYFSAVKPGNPGDAVKKIMDTYKHRTNEVAMAANKLVSKGRNQAANKKGAAKKVSKVKKEKTGKA